MGPYLSISGAIWTTDIVVQPLVEGLLWLGAPPLISDFRFNKLARVFVALREGLKDLRRRYGQLVPPSSIQIPGRYFPLTATSPRFYPLATSFTLDGKVASFKYNGYLKSKDPSCLVFTATLDDTGAVPDNKRQIVVKFVERYGKDAHELLAQNSFAPKLYYCGDIWHDNSVANKGCGPRKMVVMEYIRGRPVTHRDCVKHHDALTHAIDLLHSRKMVHGDLRSPNVMVTDDQNCPIQILDFDWAGMQGEARYPLRLSKGIDWAPSVEDYELIEYEHDKYMLEQLNYL